MAKPAQPRAALARFRRPWLVVALALTVAGAVSAVRPPEYVADEILMLARGG